MSLCLNVDFSDFSLNYLSYLSNQLEITYYLNKKLCYFYNCDLQLRCQRRIKITQKTWIVPGG